MGYQVSCGHTQFLWNRVWPDQTNTLTADAIVSSYSSLISRLSCTPRCSCS